MPREQPWLPKPEHGEGSGWHHARSLLTPCSADRFSPSASIKPLWEIHDMPNTMPCFREIFPFHQSVQWQGHWALFLPPFQMRKWTLRETKWLAHLLRSAPTWFKPVLWATVPPVTLILALAGISTSHCATARARSTHFSLPISA